MTFDEFYGFIETLPQPEFWYLCAAVLFLFAGLIFFLRRQPKHVVAYRTENGEVTVSRHAIVELVQTSCAQLGEVAKPRVKIRIKRGTPHFDVRVKLLGGGRLRQIEETLQTHLRRALTENLGIEQLGAINIVAVGFKSGRITEPTPTQAKLLPSQEGGSPERETNSSSL
jgi:hypothetical protein